MHVFLCWSGCVCCYFFCINSSAFVLVCSSKDSTLSVLSVLTEVWIHGHTSTQPTILQLTHNKKYINISINNDEKKNSVSVESSSLRRRECFTVHACLTVWFFFFQMSMLIMSLNLLSYLRHKSRFRKWKKNVMFWFKVCWFHISVNFSTTALFLYVFGVFSTLVGG